MTKVLILGAGKIGRCIAAFLNDSGDYEVRVGDAYPEAIAHLTQLTGVGGDAIDAADRVQLEKAMSDRDIVISALSFRYNPLIAEVAAATGTSYFDLTEDVETTRRVRAIADAAADGQIFMPQCGLAPGFISVIAQHLCGRFDRLDTVHMRVGALPQFPTNALKYNLTWSTDGLINEYCNPCEAIHEGQLIDVLPLEGLEHFSLDGVRYEAFNTSGGLGTLCETLNGKVRELNYRTIRYQGHRELMKFLVNGLQLGHRRHLLKDILENAVPVTWQDVVIVFCSVTGYQKDRLIQLSDARKVYDQDIHGRHWAAIQVTTAAALCAAVDLFVQGTLPQRGFVKQEDIPFGDLIENRFGKYYEAAIRPTVPPVSEL